MRFWDYVPSKLDPQSCWEWQGGKTSSGYGAFWIRDSTRSAHRMSYELTYGPIPRGLIVRHKCDNRSCVNPGHLELGTYRQNAQDVNDRGYRCRGEDHPKAKLTKVQAQELVTLYRSGMRQHELADRYGITKAAVSLILRGRNWKSVTGGVDIRENTPDRRHREAADMRKGGMTTAEIAQHFGVSRSTILNWLKV